MSLIVFCFPCCIDERPPPRRRPRIDRSQIGLPTNFVHTTHMGMGEVGGAGTDMKHIQNSMRSKGEYDQNTVGITTSLNNCIDLTQRNNLHDDNESNLHDNESNLHDNERSNLHDNETPLSSNSGSEHDESNVA